MKFVIKKFPDVLNNLNYLHSLFKEVCNKNNINCLNYLTENFKNKINANIDNNFCMRSICENNNEDCFLFMIENYLSLNLIFDDFYLAKITCQKKYNYICKYLIDFIKEDIIKNYIMNILNVACKSDNIEIFSYLIKKYQITVENINNLMETACGNNNILIASYITDNFKNIINGKSIYKSLELFVLENKYFPIISHLLFNYNVSLNLYLYKIFTNRGIHGLEINCVSLYQDKEAQDFLSSFYDNDMFIPMDEVLIVDLEKYYQYYPDVEVFDIKKYLEDSQEMIESYARKKWDT